MKVAFTRIGHNDRGQTSFQAWEFSLPERGDFGYVADYLDAKGMSVWGVQEGYVHAHNAIRTQLVMLGGSFRVTTTDGDSRIFAAGDMVIPEDTSGDGHTVEYLGTGNCISLFVELHPAGMEKLLSQSVAIN